MKRRPVEWLGDGGEDDESTPSVRSMTFEIIDHWVATDADQLILPVRVLKKTDVNIESEEGYTAILKQYGGESLLNDMLMSEQELDRGSRWTLWREGPRLEIEPAGDLDD